VVDLLIDTSVLIEKIRTKKGIFDKIVLRSKNGDFQLFTSSIVLAELWRGNKMGDKGVEKDVGLVIQPLMIMTVDGEVGKMAGKLMRRYGIDGFDALIAATAVVNKVILVTLNKKHFEKIKGLKLYNE
jgi:predicted nucleic acid-binding protein